MIVVPLLIVLAMVTAALAVLAVRHGQVAARADLLSSELAAAESRAGIERSERIKSSRDLDRQKRDLDRQKEWAALLFNSSRDPVFVHGISTSGLPGPIAQVNDAACEFLGHDRDKLTMMTPLDIEDAPVPTYVLGYTRTELAVMTDEEIAARQNVTSTARHLMSRVMSEGQVVYERVYITRTGDRIPVEVTARRVDIQDRPMILCAAHDITERRRVRQALRESEQRFQDFFAHSPIGVAMCDANRELMDVNAACLRLFGAPGPQEFSRFNLFDNDCMSAETRQMLARGENAAYEAVIDFDRLRQDGAFVTSRGGKAYLDITIHNMGLDEQYRPKGFLAQVQDVTRRRLAENALRQSERQLRQAQKMEAIGTLAGGIAHDFNNILTPIMGYTEMVLHTDLAGSDESREFLGEVLKASHRAKDLVNQILTFSRQSEAEGQPVKLTPIVKEVIKQLRTTLPPSVEVVQILKASPDVVMANPTQIHQVVMNLCANAAHSMRESGGTLEVRIGEFMQQERGGGALPQLTPGRYLRLSVKDTGVGMRQETIERIFEPFFTTKPSGEGTGMGLAVVHGIVSSLKGAITVESRPGEGATFIVALPAAALHEAIPDALVEAPPTGNGCVLFVDDEADIVNMEARMLTTLGYRAVVANSGAEALEMFARAPDRFDVVITDQIMPGMSGMEMAREMLARRPDLPVILCTGFSETISAQQAVAVGIREFLLKPISMRTLAETIQSVLNGP